MNDYLPVTITPDEIADCDLLGSIALLEDSHCHGSARILQKVLNAQPALRIPEPGLWAVVEADTLLDPFRSTFFNTPRGWRCVRDGAKREWSDLRDVTLIRDGVES